MMNRFAYRQIEPSAFAKAALAAILFAAQALAAQDVPAPPSASAHKVLHAHAKAHPAAKPEQPAPTAAALPTAPPAPRWPANDKPNAAEIVWDASGLRIEASNASLQQILKQVSMLTGAKVEGMNNDERVFGAYGPGLARDVVSQLLQGSNYNVLMIGDQGQGAPRQIVLSSRSTGPAASAAPANQNNGDDDSDSDVDDQPQPPIPPGRTNFGPGGPPHTPQEMLQQMQQRQQEMQQNQQPH